MADISRLIVQIDVQGEQKALAAIKGVEQAGKQASASMAAGAQQAQRATATVVLEFDKLKKSTESAGTAAKKTHRDFTDMFRDLVNAREGLAGLVGGMLRLGTGVYLVQRALQTTTNVIKEMVSPFMEAASAMEQMSMAYSVLAESPAGGQGLLNYITELSTKVPVTIDAFDKANRTLLGFGFTSKEIEPILLRLADVTQGNSENFAHLALVYGQVRAQGKAMQQDMYQFVNAGIPIMEALADVIGKPTAAIREMVREGEIGLDEFEQAIINLTSEGGRFYNFTKEAADTLGGQMTSAANNLKLIFAEMGEGLANSVKNAVAAANEGMKQIREDQNLRAVSQSILDLVAPGSGKRLLSAEQLPDYIPLNAAREAMRGRTALPTTFEGNVRSAYSSVLADIDEVQAKFDQYTKDMDESDARLRIKAPRYLNSFYNKELERLRALRDLFAVFNTGAAGQSALAGPKGPTDLFGAGGKEKALSMDIPGLWGNLYNPDTGMPIFELNSLFPITMGQVAPYPYRGTVEPRPTTGVPEIDESLGMRGGFGAPGWMTGGGGGIKFGNVQGKGSAQASGVASLLGGGLKEQLEWLANDAAAQKAQDRLDKIQWLMDNMSLPPDTAEQIYDLGAGIGEMVTNTTIDSFVSAMQELGAGTLNAGEAFKKYMATITAQMAPMFIRAGLEMIGTSGGDPLKIGIGIGLLALGGISAIASGALGAGSSSGVRYDYGALATTVNPYGTNVGSFANGGVFNSPSLSSYSNGVYNSPRFFAFANGGVFGEAGPEAIMPLARGANGKLGVMASGGVSVLVQNIDQSGRGVSVTQEESTGPGGEKIIRNIIRDVVNETIASGKADSALRSRNLAASGARARS